MDLHKIAKVTRLNRLSKGRMLLIAAAVTWSTMNCSLDNCIAAEAADAAALGESAFSASMDKMRLGGIPYRNSSGQIVISGSMSDNDYILTGCEPQAQMAYNIARASEPAITMDMLEIADELGSSMEGLEYSVKTASSIKSKIERKTDTAIRQGRLPKSDVEYVQETGDLIRYTQIVPHNQMADMTNKTIALLMAKGYVLEKVDNKYLNPNGRYKAIHLDIATAQGVHFEMQIHSPETLAANRATHAMYEEWRSPDTKAERKEQLYKVIRSIYGAVPQPKDIMTVKNYSRI
ncbi:hypothetical protein [Anaerovibrio sp.]|uniref:hypothetical protein n=1 Tax=Anaerovibrio sp. TaxID=1872532 RepID=UPI003F1405E4